MQKVEQEDLTFEVGEAPKDQGHDDGNDALNWGGISGLIEDAETRVLRGDPQEELITVLAKLEEDTRYFEGDFKNVHTRINSALTQAKQTSRNPGTIYRDLIYARTLNDKLNAGQSESDLEPDSDSDSEPESDSDSEPESIEPSDAEPESDSDLDSEHHYSPNAIFVIP